MSYALFWDITQRRLVVPSGVPRGGWGVQTPPAEIPKALQNHAKLNPICEKLLKIAEFRTPKPQKIKEKRQ
jgi:hypothetical protein